MEHLRRTSKIEAIHAFMNELKEEKQSLSKVDIYRKYESVLKCIRPLDIFYLPMHQNDTALSIETIKKQAGKFVNAFGHGLEENQPSSYDAYVFTFMLKENSLIEEHLNQIKPWLDKAVIKMHKKDILRALEKCLSFEQNFLKREMILYPVLEKKLPTTKPLQVLWSLHDDARTTLKKLLVMLRNDDFILNDFIMMIGLYYHLIFTLNRIERLILFPVADQLLDTETKNDLFEESRAYGYVFIDSLPKTKSKTSKLTIENGFIKTTTGALSIEQFKGVMSFMPFDITFVDERDKVTYFNDRKERHFPRSPSIIGRLVKHCHPPKSVHIVEEILDAFKQGNKDMAEFWIKYKTSLIYISYYAVRDEHKQYLGTLEVSQDVTHIQTLEGEQRFVKWT